MSPRSPYYALALSAALGTATGCGVHNQIPESDASLDPSRLLMAAIGQTVPGDCDGNGINDDEELAAGSATDCDANGVIDHCEPTDVVIDQWALGVLDYSSEFAPTGWSADQVLGEPDVFVYADLPEAWAPRPRNGSIEHILVSFEQPVYATAVTIRETYGNGMVIRVDLLDLDGEFHNAWEGDDPSEVGAPADFRIDLPQSTMLIQGVRVHIDTDTHLAIWEELDAIQLTGLAPGLTDCNSNGQSDTCDEDADGDGIPDDCDVLSGDILDCNSNGVDDLLDLAAGTSEDCDSDGLPDECGDDLDADGWVDGCDACAESDTGETIVIGECDTDVLNLPGENAGCTMADELAACSASARNHGQFVRCVVKLTAAWQRAGLIRPPEQGQIRRCAARDGKPSKKPLDRVRDKPGRGRADRLK